MIVADTEDQAVFNTDLTEMKDVLCDQILLSSTLIQSCRFDGYELHSVGLGCAGSVALWARLCCGMEEWMQIHI